MNLKNKMRGMYACALGALIMPAGLAMGHGSDRLVADLSGGQENPPVTTGAYGCGSFTIDTNANTLTYHITFTGLTGVETAAHIHGPAAPGVNAGVVFGLGTGNPKTGVWTYPESMEADILGGLMYVNIHSTTSPGGEIRGQIGHFVSPMNGFQEPPPVTAAGSGWGHFTIDTDANMLNYHIVINSLTGTETAAHIHGASLIGVNSGVVHPLPAGSPKIGSWNYPEAMEEAILNGRTYVNVHSSIAPGGEIRGQITNLVTPVDSSQENPPIPAASGAGGCAIFAINPATDQLSYYIRRAGLTGAETASHIHGYTGPTGSAGVVHGLPAGDNKIGTWAYPAANEADILAGRTYLNHHTAANPGGEIRGQIYFPGPKSVAPEMGDGDCDTDGDVDLTDFGQFQLCFTGPGGMVSPGCECVDFDGDGDADLADFGAFQLAFTGPL